MAAAVQPPRRMSASAAAGRGGLPSPSSDARRRARRSASPGARLGRSGARARRREAAAFSALRASALRVAAAPRGCARPETLAAAVLGVPTGANKGAALVGRPRPGSESHRLPSAARRARQRGAAPRATAGVSEPATDSSSDSEGSDSDELLGGGALATPSDSVITAVASDGEDSALDDPLHMSGRAQRYAPELPDDFWSDDWTGSPPSAVVLDMSSSDEDGSSVVKLNFRVPCHVQYGQRVAVMGSHNVMGAWDVHEAVPLRWHEGDVWTGSISVPAGESYAYKVVVTEKNRVVRWQKGANAQLAVPPEAEGTLGVCQDIDGQGCGDEDDFAALWSNEMLLEPADEEAFEDDDDDSDDDIPDSSVLLRAFERSYRASPDPDYYQHEAERIDDAVRNISEIPAPEAASAAADPSPAAGGASDQDDDTAAAIKIMGRYLAASVEETPYVDGSDDVALEGDDAADDAAEDAASGSDVDADDSQQERSEARDSFRSDEEIVIDDMDEIADALGWDASSSGSDSELGMPQAAVDAAMEELRAASKVLEEESQAEEDETAAGPAAGEIDARDQPPSDADAAMQATVDAAMCAAAEQLEKESEAEEETGTALAGSTISSKDQALEEEADAGMLEATKAATEALREVSKAAVELEKDLSLLAAEGLETSKPWAATLEVSTAQTELEEDVHLVFAEGLGEATKAALPTKCVRRPAHRGLSGGTAELPDLAPAGYAAAIEKMQACMDEGFVERQAKATAPEGEKQSAPTAESRRVDRMSDAPGRAPTDAPPAMTTSEEEEGPMPPSLKPSSGAHASAESAIEDTAQKDVEVAPAGYAAAMEKMQACMDEGFVESQAKPTAAEEQQQQSAPTAASRDVDKMGDASASASSSEAQVSTEGAEQDASKKHLRVAGAAVRAHMSEADARRRERMKYYVERVGRAIKKANGAPRAKPTTTNREKQPAEEAVGMHAANLSEAKETLHSDAPADIERLESSPVYEQLRKQLAASKPNAVLGTPNEEKREHFFKSAWLWASMAVPTFVACVATIINSPRVRPCPASVPVPTHRAATSAASQCCCASPPRRIAATLRALLA